MVTPDAARYDCGSPSAGSGMASSMLMDQYVGQLAAAIDCWRMPKDIPLPPPFPGSVCRKGP